MLVLVILKEVAADLVTCVGLHLAKLHNITFFIIISMVTGTMQKAQVEYVSVEMSHEQIYFVAVYHIK